MIRKINFLEIRKDALNTFKRGSSLSGFIIIYYILPITASVIAIFLLGMKLDTSLFKTLISGISLFSGLLFSIMFIVSENYKKRRLNLDSEQEEISIYLSRYKRFSEDITSLISYTIILALYIISVAVIASLYESMPSYRFNLVLEVFWSISLLFLYQFLLFVLVILKEIYAMQYDELQS